MHGVCHDIPAFCAHAPPSHAMPPTYPAFFGRQLSRAPVTVVRPRTQAQCVGYSGNQSYRLLSGNGGAGWARARPLPQSCIAHAAPLKSPPTHLHRCPAHRLHMWPGCAKPHGLSRPQTPPAPGANYWARRPSGLVGACAFHAQRQLCGGV